MLCHSIGVHTVYIPAVLMYSILHTSCNLSCPDCVMGMLCSIHNKYSLLSFCMYSLRYATCATIACIVSTAIRQCLCVRQLPLLPFCTLLFENYFIFCPPPFSGRS